jgi:hypothetical protein
MPENGTRHEYSRESLSSHKGTSRSAELWSYSFMHAKSETSETRNVIVIFGSPYDSFHKLF